MRSVAGYSPSPFATRAEYCPVIRYSQIHKHLRVDTTISQGMVDTVGSACSSSVYIGVVKM
jgi:hypothetical protein